MRRSCRCRPHLLRKLRGCTSDSSAPDQTDSRRLQFSFPHHETDEEHNRKVHSGRLPAFCGVRHRARHNHSRSRDSRSLHRPRSPRRYLLGSIWHGHTESVGYQYKTSELSRLRLSDAASAAAKIHKAGAPRWRHLWEVWLSRQRASVVRRPHLSISQVHAGVPTVADMAGAAKPRRFATSFSVASLNERPQR